MELEEINGKEKLLMTPIKTQERSGESGNLDVGVFVMFSI
jgi:hypothetical protein